MNSGFPAVRVELDQLRKGPVEWSGELPAESGAWGLDEICLLGRPKLTIRAEDAGSGGVRVRGVIETRFGLTCRRCLSALDEPTAIEFDLRFDPAIQSWEEEGGMFGLDSDAASLDLFGPLREELRLALPEYPECPDGCGGLCPKCGVDLKKMECDCHHGEPDPRWEVLRELVPDGQPSAAEPDEELDGKEG